jgi:ABC-type bacteriocin/lantibiotic exporter with double-glycine peptidase domain
MRTDSALRILAPYLFWIISGSAIMIAIIDSLDINVVQQITATTGEQMEFLGIGNTILQKGKNDCGPAALEMILNHYDIPASPESLSSGLSPGQNGMTMFSLKMILERYHLQAMGLRIPIKQLSLIPTPAILFVRKNHFVVFDSVDTSGGAYLRDPSLGCLRISGSMLRTIWHGEVLIITRSREIQITSKN